MGVTLILLFPQYLPILSRGDNREFFESMEHFTTFLARRRNRLVILESHCDVGPSDSAISQLDMQAGIPASPRVLLIAASLRYMGGQAVMAQRLIDDLRHDEVRIEFLAVDPQLPGMLRHLERIKYVRTLGVHRVHFSFLKSVPRHDVLHVFSASYSSFLVSPAPAIIAGRVFGKSVVLNYHSGEAEDHLQRSGWLTRWLLGLADSIVVQSSYLVSVFQRFGFRAWPFRII